MVALVTPMDESGNVDTSSLEKLVLWHIAQGTDAIIVMGTTGESATLDANEHCQVIRQVVSYVDGSIPVIAGTGANSTTEAIHLTRCAKDAGVDACLLVTPYYNKPTQEGLVLHHKAIAEAVDIPQILYNVPGRTAVDMLPETIAILSKVNNIIGVKEATGNLERVTQIKKLCGDDFEIYAGDDATSRELMLMGGHGVISVTSNVAPAAMHDMCMAALAGETDKAKAIDDTLVGLHHDLFLESNPMPVKWAMQQMGRIPVGIRLPLTWFSVQYHKKLTDAMKLAGVL